MTRIRNLSTLLALAGVAALPACSMFGGGGSHQASNTSYPPPAQSYAATPSYGSGAPQASSTEMTSNTIRDVQQSLQQDGLYRGQIDGVWGPQTRSAVRRYQQQHNITVTGQLDQETLSSMNLGGTNQGSAQQPASQRYGSNEQPNYNQPPSGNPPPQSTEQPNTSNTR